MSITEKRQEKFDRVVANRQHDLAILLENVHDKHNIGAVLRSCDSVGIADVYVLFTMEGLDQKYFKVGQQASSGALKWVRTHFYRDREACFKEVRKKYKHILGTHLDSKAKSLYDLDLSESTLLVFGNEHQGITDETLKHLDGNFIIPQMGMVQSLNISVACAVTLYEVARQRIKAGKYKEVSEERKAYQQELSDYYSKINKTRERAIFNKRLRPDFLGDLQ